MRVSFRAFALVLIASCANRGSDQGDTAGATARGAAGTTEVSRACAEVAELFRIIGATPVYVRADSLPALPGDGRRAGCLVHAEGILGGRATVPFLSGALADSIGPSWTRDSTMVADGRGGAAYGVRRGAALCLFHVSWTMKVRYDPRADPSPYSADVVCAP